MKMKWKIIAPVSFILVALVILTSHVSSLRFASFTEDLFRDRVYQAASGFRKHLSDCEWNTQVASMVIAAKTALPEAIIAGDREEIQSIINHAVTVNNVDFFVITDKDGTVLARSLYPDRYGDSILNQHNVYEGTLGNSSTFLEVGTMITVSLRSGCPVFDDTGEVIGVVVSGIRLDSEETLSWFKEHYHADFSVHYQGKRLASTITVNGQSIGDIPMDADAAHWVYEHKEEYFKAVDIMGESFSSLFIPLLDNEGEVFSVVTVAWSNLELLAEKNAMQMGLIGVGVIGLLCSLIILLFISEGITQPVTLLSHLVADVTRGNISEIDLCRTEFAKDEIGVLTRDMYSMVEVIKAISNDLAHLTSDLDSFGAMEIQIDESRYTGFYREIIDGIRRLAESVAVMRKMMEVLDHLDTMISITDFDYNLLYVNNSMIATHNIDRENYFGTKCFRTIRGLDNPCNVFQLCHVLPNADLLP
ncbi:MAG: cache domain-containing protein, partial [Symbiobacteriaceae bacterium]|nr:cache domain-containing protein [Symbiobacteriaceae bacterium]